MRTLTAKPFGVDLLTAAPGDMASKVNDIIDGGGSVFVAGLGVPRDVVDLCHSRNVLVVSMCGKVRHAIAAVEAGYVDARLWAAEGEDDPPAVRRKADVEGVDY